MQAIWARRPGEPALWYNRFQVYLHLGPSRTIHAAYRRSAQLEALRTPHPHPGWRRSAERWEWARRAAAWDEAQEHARDADSFQDAAAPDAGAPVEESDPDRQRFAMVDRLLAVVYAVILHAELESMTSSEARQALPTLRMFFKDLLQAHQQEAGALGARQGNEGIPPFSADELRQAHRELERWRAIVGEQTGGSPLGADMPASGTKPQEDPAHGEPPPSERGRSMGAAGREHLLESGENWLPLRDVLAALYTDETSARRIAGQARVDKGRIRFGATAVDMWHAILSEAVKLNRLDAVIEVVMYEYGANRRLLDAVGYLRQSRGPSSPGLPPE